MKHRRISRTCAVMAGSAVVALDAAGITFQNANAIDDVPQCTVRTPTASAAGKLATAFGYDLGGDAGRGTVKT
ncbi:hypothetical protein ACNPQM_14325 [Streptomyces sp. NPDC056231]|uniref:hypothetical protein n=1 Tax=Streptomyces sp. NPDC056231 TaxID=3345755 RepID=UPI003AAD3697